MKKALNMFLDQRELESKICSVIMVLGRKALK